MNLKRTDILFVFPNIELPSNLRFSFHQGVGCIAAYLEKHNINTAAFIWNDPINISDLVDRMVKQYRPRVIGFTCYDNNYYLIKLISQAIKQLEPGITIIMGGPTPSFTDRLIMQDNPAIDICVRGEGELTTYELLNVLESGGSLAGVKGITYRQGEQIVRTRDRPFIRSLAKLPSPYLSGKFPMPRDRKFEIMTSRGCVYRCTFCQFTAMFGGKIRFYPMERVLAELETIARMAHEKGNSKEFILEFSDDSFCVNKERVRSICNFVKTHELFQHAKMSCQTRGDTVNRKILELLYESGFRSIGFGLESAVPEVLKRMNKARKNRHNQCNTIDGLESEREFLKKFKNSVLMAKEIGFHTTVSIILGLPGETLQQGEQTIKFVEQLGVDRYIHNYLALLPGTKLFHTLEKNAPAKINLSGCGGIRDHFYKIKYNYDIRQVPVLPNAACFSDIAHLAQITAGITHIYPPAYPAGIFFNNTQPDTERRAFQWLKDIVGFSTRVFLLTGDYREEKCYESRKQFVDSGVPLFLLYFVRQKKTGNPRLPFETYPGIYDLLYAPYPEPYPPVNDAAREVVNLTINSAKDLEFLQKSLYKAESRGTITLDKRFIEPGFVVEDQCRWSCRSCQAPRMSRFFINNNHTIIPCKHGGVVGKIGDRFRDIKKNIEVYREKEIKIRGCNTCPVRESCSKCLYPYPMDSSEYCRLHRQFPMMGELFTLMEIVRRISFPAKHKTNGISMRVYPADQKKQPIVKKSLREIICGDECYIYDLDREKARPVSRLFIDILIHLKQGLEMDALVSRLTEAYAVSTQKMERTIKKALSIAERHGYLLKSR